MSWSVYRPGEGRVARFSALMIMLAPSTPHLAEELWEQTGHVGSIHSQSFPSLDEEFVAALKQQLNRRELIEQVASIESTLLT